MAVNLPDIRHASVFQKKVLLRSDLDAPIQESWVVVDDTRLQASCVTLEYLLRQNAHVIMIGHLRRPKGIDPSLSLLPIVQWFSEHLHIPNAKFMIQDTTLGECKAWKLSDNLTILENIRFFKEEYDNDPVFARKLAGLGDIYVDDAFASLHRTHASIVGLPKLLSHYAGLRLQKEVETLSEVMECPKRPLTVVIGGAKVETKLPLIEKMCTFADTVLVGGKIVQAKEEILRVSEKASSGHRATLIIAAHNQSHTDCASQSVDDFMRVIEQSKTVVWNGPIGKTEDGDDVQKTSEGTRRLAQGIIQSGAFSVVGGGDTLEFLQRENILDKFSFFSTGGGAMLAFLSGEKLPGIEALLRP